MEHVESVECPIQRHRVCSASHRGNRSHPADRKVRKVGGIPGIPIQIAVPEMET